MRSLFAIARNTWLETIRDRILNTIVLFALVMIAASLLLGQLSAGQDIKIIKDLGLAAINFFGVVIAVFVGTNLLYRELDKRTVFVVLTKPVSRWRFLGGKLLGLLATLTVLSGAMGGGYLLLLASIGVKLHSGLYIALGFAWFELLVLTTLTLLFATFTTPVLSAVYVLALYFIGHNLNTFRHLVEQTIPGIKEALLALFYVLPNLTLFDIKNQVVYGFSPAPVQIFWVGVYAVLYSLALYALAAAVFARREF
ncbi:MAG: ABC transporter permease subunit [Candidatus Sericytochromatia bacterium]|nr:ABC transporter permease subunit [Candidatus Sericytochromatia bacterium]